MARQGQWPREFTVPLGALQSELNRLFDEYWSPSRFAAGTSPPADSEPAETWAPAVDLWETAVAFVICVEVPGVDPASIDLSLTGNTLTIRGEKPPEADADAEPSATLRERRFGPFHRRIVLPGDIDFEATQAEARLGLLRITLPKRDVGRPRTIPVQAR